MITITDMRNWVMDRTPADNPLEGDLFFTDEEIVSAMKAAAREFNSVPPYVIFADPNQLDDSTNMMFEATAEFLYKAKRHSLGRNAFTYSGGNVSVDEDNQKLKFFELQIAALMGWREQAKAFKLKYDTTGYYGRLA